MTSLQAARFLCDRWRAQPQRSDLVWPTEAWDDLRAAGVTRWTIDAEFGGAQLPPEELIEGCLELARGELLATFVLSQFQAACQRLAIAASLELRRRWLPALAKGDAFATVGISHLTTSRQHTAPPVRARPDADGYRLTGEIPWVTGAARADVIVAGGTLDDGRQILAAISTDRAGVVAGEPLRLLALTGSETGSVVLEDVAVARDEIIAGPVAGVVQQSSTGGAGSLMTSTLALGHAYGSLDFLEREASQRTSLEPIAGALRSEADDLRRDLAAAAGRRSENVSTPEQLRTRATDLALRASQALLTATKGAGFVAGHDAERLAREALFFLVWSCPQSVANQLLQNFGGCENVA
jgi:alkylation response protein AidB-like acyl-CoA dehydrogenase